jgi:hypothetical protein
MSTLTITPIRSVAERQAHPLPASTPVPAQRLLAVEFVSLDGRSWKAIGGAETVAEAIADARESCPDGTSWHPRSWNDLYGD